MIVSKGISSNLMKISAKRRRSKEEIKETKRREEYEKQQTIKKLHEHEVMAQQIANMQEEMDRAKSVQKQV